MSLAILAKSLDVFNAFGATDFRLTGGEPTVHPEFETVLKNISDRGHRIRLVSNGKRFLGKESAMPLLELVDMCWISAYGTTAERHAQMAGAGALPLQAIERWVAEYTAQNASIGLSVLLSPGDSAHIDEALDRFSCLGIKRLRFLPLEPDGRANLVPARSWSGWQSELKQIYEQLICRARNATFRVLTLNDPFDLGGQFSHGWESCLLRSRRMFSVVPSGDIYSCCFNAYQPEHKLGNVNDAGIIEFLPGWCVRTPELPCRAFDHSYWKDALPQKTTCPISTISVSTMLETRSDIAMKHGSSNKSTAQAKA